MALIGLKYPVVGKYNESGGTVSHTDGMVLAKAIQANISINQFGARLYADDGLSESDEGFRIQAGAGEQNRPPKQKSRQDLCDD